LIRFEIRGVRFVLPLLTIFAPILALHLGMRASIGSLLLALGAHEASHLLIAAVLKVEISEISLMPFGGSAKIGNPYHLPKLKMIGVAAAGPASNLLIVLLVSSDAYWEWIAFDAALRLIEPNIVLFLFNLIPALPLDGGRIMTAALSAFIGESRALRTGILCGRCLAALLIALMICGGIRSRVWNLSFLLAAVFIITSEKNERQALDISKARRIQEGMQGFDMRPARLYHIDGRHSAEKALSLLRPRENAWFVIMNEGIPVQLLDSRTLLARASDGNSAATKLLDYPGIRLNCVSR